MANINEVIGARDNLLLAIHSMEYHISKSRINQDDHEFVSSVADEYIHDAFVAALTGLYKECAISLETAKKYWYQENSNSATKNTLCHLEIEVDNLLNILK